MSVPFPFSSKSSDFTVYHVRVELAGASKTMLPIANTIVQALVYSVGVLKNLTIQIQVIRIIIEFELLRY